jgi:RNA polymerase sigma-70 factor (ECF subfamily)
LIIFTCCLFLWEEGILLTIEEFILSAVDKFEFEKLVHPLLRSMYSTAMRMTHNHDEAQDIVQETLFKAFRAFDQFKKNTNFRAWIFRILVNTYITAYRKIKKQPQKVSYDDLEEFYLYKRLDEEESMQEVAKEDFIENMFDDDVKSALESLPFQFRVVVLLCDVEGFSYNEIAEILNAPLGTVMSRLFRGRKLLQRSLWKYAKEKGYLIHEKK